MKAKKFLSILILVFIVMSLLSIFINAATNVPDSNISPEESTNFFSNRNARDNMSSAVDEGKDSVSSAIDDGKDKVSSALENGKDMASSAADDVKNGMENTENGNNTLKIIIGIILAVAVIIIIVIMIAKSCNKSNKK